LFEDNLFWHKAPERDLPVKERSSHRERQKQEQLQKGEYRPDAGYSMAART
jgi:hypothetical protein